MGRSFLCEPLLQLSLALFIEVLCFLMVPTNPFMKSLYHCYSWGFSIMRPLQMQVRYLAASR